MIDSSNDDPNPYAAPRSAPSLEAPESSHNEPAVSTVNTIAPRYGAALVDNLLAMLFAVIVAKAISNELLGLQLAAGLLAYLAYYFISEALIGRTPCKLIAGLVVVQKDGRRITWKQVLIRTLFRILEVNPLLFGALPAGVLIVWSKHHQRLGDMVAGTVVVTTRALRRARYGGTLRE